MALSTMSGMKASGMPSASSSRALMSSGGSMALSSMGGVATSGMLGSSSGRASMSSGGFFPLSSSTLSGEKGYYPDDDFTNAISSVPPDKRVPPR